MRGRGSIGPVTWGGSCADGNLEYLGRVDNQVKLRGVRIELGEIESVLRTHPSVRDAVALVSQAGGDDARLIAYVVAGARRPESSELRRFVRERLPDHTVPSAFIFLDALPMTPNGKLDRRALLSLAPTPAEGARTYVAPRTPPRTPWPRSWPRCSRSTGWAFMTISSSSAATRFSPSR